MGLPLGAAPRWVIDSGCLGLALGLLVMAGVFIAQLLSVHALEVALTLALVCGAAAAAAVAVASYRDQIVVRRIVARLRDPKRRPEMVAELQRKVRIALQSRDSFRIEEALRYALEPLIVAGCWDEVAELAGQATKWHPRQAFAKWLAGVQALAHLHRGDPLGAGAALEQVEVEGPWLEAVDALRLALAGEGDAALERLGDDPSRVGLAIRHQRRLAKVHALASLGRREDARGLLREMRGEGEDMLRAALDPEGPASGLAASLLGPGGGPFRAAG